MLCMQTVQNNGTLYVHAVFYPTGLSLDPTDEDHDPSAILVKSHREIAIQSQIELFTRLEVKLEPHLPLPPRALTGREGNFVPDSVGVACCSSRLKLLLFIGGTIQLLAMT